MPDSETCQKLSVRRSDVVNATSRSGPEAFGDSLEIVIVSATM